MSDRQLLPSNASAQEVALSGAVARVGDVPVPNRDLYNADKCPAPLLPWLAWALSLDEWNTQWTEAQKRQAIKDSIFVHRHKGTIGAVRRALGALGFGAQVQEWFNQVPAGAAYTYNLLLEVDQVGISQGDIVQVKDVVASTKNLRSHLDKVAVSVKSRAGPIIASVAGIGTEITVLYGDGSDAFDLISNGTALSNGEYIANGIKFN
ncbi:MAG TPA: phage tail protein I [Abditibacteriaceae bacterium]|jgi:phage tail P2-like protein